MATFKLSGPSSQTSTTPIAILSSEIWLQIINCLPICDLLNLYKSHRVFYDLALAKLYHTIHFNDPDVKVDSVHRLLFDKKHSSAIYDLPSFVRTLQSSTSLQSLVSHASFSWGLDLNTAVKPDMSNILTMIGRSLKKLHYAPPTWDYIVPRLYSATSVYMPVPKKERSNLRETIYSLFTVPTLQDITLCHLQRTFSVDENFNIFQVPFRPPSPYRQDLSKKETVDIKYLSIQDTRLEDLGDLAEIMLWPKALKGFKCTLVNTSNYLDEYPHDPSQLAYMLEPQSASLEQISFDCNTSLSYLGTFGPSLRQFPMLKRISMPRNFLATFSARECRGYVSGYEGPDDYMHAGYIELHLALPPALEELILNVDVEYHSLEEDEYFPDPHVREGIWEVAMHKEELYPSLQRMVLWKSCEPDECTNAEKAMQERRMLGWLGISQDFEVVGVEFDYKVTEVAPGFKNPLKVL